MPMSYANYKYDFYWVHQLFQPPTTIEDHERMAGNVFSMFGNRVDIICLQKKRSKSNIQMQINISFN